MIRFSNKIVTEMDDFAHVIYDTKHEYIYLQIGDYIKNDDHSQILLSERETKRLIEMLRCALEVMEVEDGGEEK